MAGEALGMMAYAPCHHLPSRAFRLPGIAAERRVPVRMGKLARGMKKIAGETGVVIARGEDQRGMVRTVAGGRDKGDPSADLRPGRHIHGLQLAGLDHRQQAVEPQRPVAFAVLHPRQLFCRTQVARVGKQRRPAIVLPDGIPPDMVGMQVSQ